tara:strand:- start:224 stop:958 length:735 start_codon:yes stop_codon:yes gene_type:complete
MIGKKKLGPPKAGKSTHGKVTESKLSKEELAEISRENGKRSAETSAMSAYEKSLPVEMDYAIEDMYADIYDPRARIAPEYKIHAAAAFFVTGTVDGASRITGLPHQTISEWKNKAEWWQPTLMKIRKEKNEELDAELTALIHKTTAELLTRLTEGEQQYYKGEPVTVLSQVGDEEPKLIPIMKPIGGRDLAAILNIISDKRTMLRGEPTSIRQTQDKGILMDELRAEFTRMAAGANAGRIVSDQ